MKALNEGDLKDAAASSEDADQIVNRTAHFVGGWIDEHVIQKSTDVSLDAEELACQCIADAKQEGIAVEDIQGEVGDLTEYIAETIDEDTQSARIRQSKTG